MDIQEILAVGGFFVLYTGFLFGGFSWMLKSQITPLKEMFTAQITPIKELLNNHITDTNKKIDELRQEMRENHKEIKEAIKK